MADDILQAARRLRPGSAWNLIGDILEPADDFTKGLTIPTQAELNQEMQKLAAINSAFSIYEDKTTLFNALWDAMNSGVLPKVPAFFDPIKAYKDAVVAEGPGVSGSV